MPKKNETKDDIVRYVASNCAISKEEKVGFILKNRDSRNVTDFTAYLADRGLTWNDVSGHILKFLQVQLAAAVVAEKCDIAKSQEWGFFVNSKYNVDALTRYLQARELTWLDVKDAIYKNLRVKEAAPYVASRSQRQTNKLHGFKVLRNNIEDLTLHLKEWELTWLDVHDEVRSIFLAREKAAASVHVANSCFLASDAEFGFHVNHKVDQVGILEILSTYQNTGITYILISTKNFQNLNI